MLHFRFSIVLPLIVTPTLWLGGTADSKLARKRVLATGLPDSCTGDYVQPENLIGFLTLANKGCAVFLDTSCAVCDGIGANKAMDCINPANPMCIRGDNDMCIDAGGKKGQTSMPIAVDGSLICNYNLLEHRSLGLVLEPAEDDVCVNTQTFRIECATTDPLEIGLVCPTGFYPVADFGMGVPVTVTPPSDYAEVPGSAVVANQSVATFKADADVASYDVTVGCAIQECVDECFEPTITMGACSGSSKFSYRIRQCNTNWEVGVGKPGTANAFAQGRLCLNTPPNPQSSGAFPFSFKFDPSLTSNQLVAQYKDVNNVQQTVQYGFIPSDPCPGSVAQLEFFFLDNNDQVGLETQNIQLDGSPLTNLNVKSTIPNKSQQPMFWCIQKPVGFNNGFTFSGTMIAENFGLGSTESVKIELYVKCLPI